MDFSVQQLLYLAIREMEGGKTDCEQTVANKFCIFLLNALNTRPKDHVRRIRMKEFFECILHLSFFFSYLSLLKCKGGIHWITLPLSVEV
jgi:hypothetical protein